MSADDLRPWWKLATAMYHRGFYDEALVSIERVLTLCPTNPHFWNAKGDTLHELQRREAALEAYEQALDLASSDTTAAVKAMNNKAVILLELGRHAEAAATLEHAAALAPDDAAVSMNLGNAYAGLRKYEQAVTAYRRAAALDSADPRIWNNLGLALQAMGRPAEALAAVERAIAYDPEYGSAWKHKGDILQDLQQWEDALAAYAKATRIMPEFAPAWINWGNVFQQMGRHDEALAHLEHATVLDPSNSLVWANKGLALMSLQRYPHALEAFQRALALDSGSALALTASCRTLGKLTPLSPQGEGLGVRTLGRLLRLNASCSMGLFCALQHLQDDGTQDGGDAADSDQKAH